MKSDDCLACACGASHPSGAVVPALDHRSLVRMEEDHPVLDGCRRNASQLLGREERRDAREPAELGDGRTEERLAPRLDARTPLLRRQLDKFDSDVDPVFRPRQSEEGVLVGARSKEDDLVVGEAGFGQLRRSPVIKDTDRGRVGDAIRGREGLSPFRLRSLSVDEAHEAPARVDDELTPLRLVVDVTAKARFEPDVRLPTLDEQHPYCTAGPHGHELTEAPSEWLEVQIWMVGVAGEQVECLDHPVAVARIEPVDRWPEVLVEADPRSAYRRRGVWHVALRCRSR